MHTILSVATIAGLAGMAALFARSMTNNPAIVETPTTVEAAEPIKKAFGLETRELWTTSKVKGSPEPPPPYRLSKAFPKVAFTEPLELTPVPGKKVWAVAERGGKIFTFTNDAAA